VAACRFGISAIYFFHDPSDTPNRRHLQVLRTIAARPGFGSAAVYLGSSRRGCRCARIQGTWFRTKEVRQQGLRRRGVPTSPRHKITRALRKQIYADLRKKFRGRLAFRPAGETADSITRTRPVRITPLGVRPAFPQERTISSVGVRLSIRVDVVPRGAGNRTRRRNRSGRAWSSNLSRETSAHRDLGSDAGRSSRCRAAELKAGLAPNAGGFAHGPAAGAVALSAEWSPRTPSAQPLPSYTPDHLQGAQAIWDTGAKRRYAHRRPPTPRRSPDSKRTATLIEPHRPRNAVHPLRYRLHDVYTNGARPARCSAVRRAHRVRHVGPLRTVPSAGGRCLACSDSRPWKCSLKASYELRSFGPPWLATCSTGGDRRPALRHRRRRDSLPLRSGTESEVERGVAARSRSCRAHDSRAREPACDPRRPGRISTLRKEQ